MNCIKYWFAIFLIEVAIWSYVIYLHFEIKELEKKRSEKRQTLFSAQDEIDDKKETLLTDIEKRLNQKIEQKELFTIKWKMI